MRWITLRIVDESNGRHTWHWPEELVQRLIAATQ